MEYNSENSWNSLAENAIYGRSNPALLTTKRSAKRIVNKIKDMARQDSQSV